MDGPQLVRKFSTSPNEIKGTQNGTSSSSVNQRNLTQGKSNVDTNDSFLGKNGSQENERLVFEKETKACETKDISVPYFKKGDDIDFKNSEALQKLPEKQIEIGFCENGQIVKFGKENSYDLCINPQNEKKCIKEKSLACKYCSKKFNQLGHLKQHEMNHTGETPFTCKYCDKKFNAKGKLKRHEMIHTGERPFSCKYCDKKFIESGKLKNHERIHTGEKPFACKNCDKNSQVQEH